MNRKHSAQQQPTKDPPSPRNRNPSLQKDFRPSRRSNAAENRERRREHSRRQEEEEQLLLEELSQLESRQNALMHKVKVDLNKEDNNRKISEARQQRKAREDENRRKKERLAFGPAAKDFKKPSPNRRKKVTDVNDSNQIHGNGKQLTEAAPAGDVDSESEFSNKQRDHIRERGPVSLYNDDLSQHSPNPTNGAVGGYLSKFSKKRDSARPKSNKRFNNVDRDDDISDLTSIPEAVYENDKNRNNRTNPASRERNGQLKEKHKPVNLPRIPSREGTEEGKSYRVPSAPHSGRRTELDERTTSAPSRLDDNDKGIMNDGDFVQLPYVRQKQFG